MLELRKIWFCASNTVTDRDSETDGVVDYWHRQTAASLMSRV